MLPTHLPIRPKYICAPMLRPIPIVGHNLSSTDNDISSNYKFRRNGALHGGSKHFAENHEGG